jgi:hypothetical protein
MTTAALVCAMLPLLLGKGAGSEMRAPIAAVVIGGNISSTLLTLILVPVVYTFLDGGAERVSRLIRWLAGSQPDEEAATPVVPGPAPVVPAATRPVPPATRPAPQSQPGAAMQPGASAPFQKRRPEAEPPG